MILSVIPQMIYSTFDSGNFFVIPGSPAEAWKTETLMESEKDYLRAKMGYGHEDIVITIVGNELLYRGLWLEHSIVLQALFPLLEDFSSDENSFSHIKIIVLSGDPTSNYSSAVEVLIQRTLVFYLVLGKMALCLSSNHLVLV